MASVSSRVEGLKILTPCYRGLSSPHVLSLWDTQREMAARAVPLGITHVSGDALLSRARNLLLAEFLRDERFSHALMVDCDTQWPAEAVVRLLAAGFDVSACGVPRRGTPPVTWNFVPVEGRPVLDLRTDFIEVERVGTGFLMISRLAADTMARLAARRFRHDFGYGPVEVAEVFRTDVIDGEYWGEDYLFCRDWKAQGGRIWVDPDMRLTHEGQTMIDGGVPRDLIFDIRDSAA